LSQCHSCRILLSAVLSAGAALGLVIAPQRVSLTKAAVLPKPEGTLTNLRACI
jgi:hypothetical protein